MNLNINNRPAQPNFNGITRYVVRGKDLPYARVFFEHAKMRINPRKATFIFETPTKNVAIKVIEGLKGRAQWFNSHMELNNVDFKLPKPLDKDQFSFYYLDGKDFKKYARKFGFLASLIKANSTLLKSIKETPQIKNMAGGRDYLTLKMCEKLDIDFEKFMQKRKIDKVVKVDFY